MKVLEEAHHIFPSAKWWIKADGCDVIESLEESVDLKWNGDIDIGDGQLQLMYLEYISRLQILKRLACDEPLSKRLMMDLISSMQDQVKKDLLFLHECRLCLN